nr:hypothetical protein [Planctomycetota bacterium]
LLDGLAPTPSTPAPAPAPEASSATSAPTPAATPVSAAAPATTPATGGDAGKNPAPKPLSTKVYAVDLGSDGRMARAILGVGTKHGIIVGNRFHIRRNNLLVATVSVMLVKDALSYCQMVPGTLADPRDDVKEGDQAVLAAAASESTPDVKK